jgi:hypothetical protein
VNATSINAPDPNAPTNVHHFFSSKRLAVNTNKQKTTPAVQPNPDYATRVPLPNATGLTRSPRLFTISTGVHIDSLKIGRNDEIFIFMRQMGIVQDDPIQMDRGHEALQH